jgi:hypothetical protein
VDLEQRTIKLPMITLYDSEIRIQMLELDSELVQVIFLLIGLRVNSEAITARLVQDFMGLRTLI